MFNEALDSDLAGLVLHLYRSEPSPSIRVCVDEETDHHARGPHLPVQARQLRQR